MVVEVRWFASLTDRTGCAAENVEVAPGTDVQALWRLLVLRHPDLESLGFRPLAACDREYAAWERTLDGVDEVAFLPPVSGG